MVHPSLMLIQDQGVSLAYNVGLMIDIQYVSLASTRCMPATVSAMDAARTAILIVQPLHFCI